MDLHAARLPRVSPSGILRNAPQIRQRELHGIFTHFPFQQPELPRLYLKTICMQLSRNEIAVLLLL